MLSQNTSCPTIRPLTVIYIRITSEKSSKPFYEREIAIP
jgi:hypothetical protein